jgi:hypothetical protein
MYDSRAEEAERLAAMLEIYCRDMLCLGLFEVAKLAPPREKVQEAARLLRQLARVQADSSARIEKIQQIERLLDVSSPKGELSAP